MCDLLSEEEIDYVFNLPHFKLIKKLQLMAGLWPYYSTWWKYCAQILLYTILFTVMIPLLKRVYERLARNWLMITKPDERAIMLRHVKVGRMYSIMIIVLLVIAAVCFSQIPAVPVVLDIIFPLNESRPKVLFVRAEYIIDPFEHYSKLYVYFLVATVLSAVSFTAIDTTYCTIVYQILGIMSVVKYRLTIATQYADGELDNSYGIIVSAISLHQKSINFVKLIEASYNVAFMFIVVGTTMFISMGVVIILNVESLDFVRFLPLLIGSVIHIFYLSLTAQKIIDYCNDLFTAIYMTEWYKISPKSKKLLRFMMLRASKPCVLTAGGLYVMNLQNFGKIMKTTASYVTVLSSFR